MARCHGRRRVVNSTWTLELPPQSDTATSVPILLARASHTVTPDLKSQRSARNSTEKLAAFSVQAKGEQPGNAAYLGALGGLRERGPRSALWTGPCLALCARLPSSSPIIPLFLPRGSPFPALAINKGLGALSDALTWGPRLSLRDSGS